MTSLAQDLEPIIQRQKGVSSTGQDGFKEKDIGRERSGSIPHPQVQAAHEAAKPSLVRKGSRNGHDIQFNTQHYKHVLGVDEYEVVWAGGSLGLALVRDLHLDLPCVRRLTGTGATESLENVTPGDALVTINNIDVQVLTYERAMEIMTSVPKPVTLRFRKVFRIHKTLKPAPILNSEIYVILWRYSVLDLGIQFRKGTLRLPEITRLTSLVAHKGMELAAVGDVLVAINEMSTQTLGYTNSMKMLASIQKPCFLTMRSRKASLYDDSSIYYAKGIRDTAVEQRKDNAAVGDVEL